MRTVLCLCVVYFAALSTHSPCAADDDVNVALARWGTIAKASSSFDGDYGAENAIDGLWTASASDKWNTKSGWDQSEPHWLIIDFKVPRTIRKVVIRHEGVVGGGETYNTGDYRLQSADSADGPWEDIVPPVTGNRKNITEHEFAPVTARAIRLLVTKGEPQANEYARIFEVEAFSRRSDITSPLAGIIIDPAYVRPAGTGFEVKARLEAVIPQSPPKGARIEVRVNGKTAAGVDAALLTNPVEIWLPATAKGQSNLLDLVYVTDAGETPANRIRYSAGGPGYFRDGAAYIMSSSHQDIAWMNSPDICIRDRDLKVISPALEKLRKSPDSRFAVETTLQLMEYLDRHPDRKDEILALTRSGRFEWGATYQQPYESMYPGESLVRQVYLGRKWLKKTLPGCDSHIAWNPDVPARAMQMPQILSKAGIPYLMMSRHEEGFYNWKSPDGSGVVAWSPGHYHESGMVFRAGTESLADGTTIVQKYNDLRASALALTKKLGGRDDYYRSRNIAPVYGVLMSSDFTGPVEMDGLISEWNTLKSDPSSHFALPSLLYSSCEDFFRAATKGNPSFDTITGERPDVWLYIHGPTHHKALDACREAGWVLPAAETFATVDAVLSGSFRDYPAERLDAAWKRAIYPDHGWGGKNGHITDRVFREAFEAGRDAGRDILNTSIRSISARAAAKKNLPSIRVFNHLSWARTGPVECALDMSGADTGDIVITTPDGKTVPHQVISRPGVPGTTEDGRMYVVFVATDVPPVGYATYYVAPRRSEARETGTTPTDFPVMENGFYRIELSEKGVKSIFDREIGKELLKTDAFSGGDVFTMQSVGNGAGEFADIQQPTMEEFDRMSGHPVTWTRIEQGPVRTTFETAAIFGHATVRLRVTLYQTIKRIDFGIDLLGWNGTKNREFRMAFPLNMAKAEIAYSVPMGVAVVGKSEIAGAAGERYTTPCVQVHPREVIDWFSASDGDYGVTIGTGTAVFDWIDPTGRAGSYPVLQPLLLASRKSCHWEGNWYLQTGDHSFRFSLVSYKGNWKNGRKAGTGSVQPLMAVYSAPAKVTPEKTLPESMSFCRVSGDNVMVTAIKKCDDDENVVIRCCEMEGTDAESEVTWFSGMTKALRTNIIEEEGTPVGSSGGTFRALIGHHAIETFKIAPVMK